MCVCVYCNWQHREGDLDCAINTNWLTVQEDCRPRQLYQKRQNLWVWKRQDFLVLISMNPDVINWNYFWWYLPLPLPRSPKPSQSPEILRSLRPWNPGDPSPPGPLRLHWEWRSTHWEKHSLQASINWKLNEQLYYIEQAESIFKLVNFGALKIFFQNFQRIL